jgi:DNA-binding ferritin-like protein
VEEGAATLQRIKQERDHDEAEFQRVVAQLSCADMEECLHSLRRLKQEQRYLEAELQRVNARLKRAVDKLSAAELEDLHSRNNNPGKVHVEHDKLDSIADGFTLMRKILREINALAAQANEASTAAIRCGATQAQVHAAALT